ncbi:MAG: hypothetical protein ABI209_01190 [Edaphobacter sp.]
MINTGANQETAISEMVGTAGASKVDTAMAVGATVIPVASVAGFNPGQTITIGDGADQTAVVAATRRGPAEITVASPLTFAHGAGPRVSDTGITLTVALSRAHASEVPVTDNVPTPGAPNHYDRRLQ